MALRAIRGVWNETTGRAYQAGVDYESDGDGTPVIIAGSQLEEDDANGDTIKYKQGVGDTALPGLADQYYTIDAAYCGVRRVQLGEDWDTGEAVFVDLDGIHVNEHLRSHQSNCHFRGPADEDTCRALVEGDWIALRLGLKTTDGTKTWRKEWRFKVKERKHALNQDGIRSFEFFGLDPSEDSREADVSEIPRNAEAETIVYPSEETTDPVQEGLIGPKAYKFSQLLNDVLPAGASLVLNAPDFNIERLPEQGDGLELLAAALQASSCDMRWDVSRLIIEQYEPAAQLVSVIVTDDHYLEARKTLGTRRKSIDSVRIERPRTYPSPDLATSTPDQNMPPANGSGASELPSYSATESGLSEDVTLYQISFIWSPTQLFTKYEPAPLRFAFGDPRYLKVQWTSDQLYGALRNSPGQVNVSPPTYFTPAKEDGYNGLDYYWKIPVIYLKIQASNADFVDVWVVSLAGFLDDVGAVATRTVKPVPNARVRLKDPITGITLGPQTTNNAGYARFNTGGNRARWYASVYHVTDAYLANKLDDFTEGHPYDDIPNNDELGPDNSVEITDEYQLADEQGIQLLVKWRAGSDPGTSGRENMDDLYEAYRRTGVFQYGTDGTEVEVVGDSSLEVDPANIGTEVQAALFSEKKIAESQEQLTTIEVTRMFSGTENEVGRVVHVISSVDEDINEAARVVTRQVTVRGPELLETWSSEVDKFVNKLESTFARKLPVEVRLKQIAKEQKRAFDWITNLSGLRGSTGNLDG